MLNLTFTTKKDPDEMREALDEAFGPGGLGLSSDTVGDVTAYTGGGGFVTATVRRVAGTTVIDLRTQEFEEDVRRFVTEAA